MKGSSEGVPQEASDDDENQSNIPNEDDDNGDHKITAHGGLGGLPQGVLCHVEKIALVVNIFSLTLHQYEIFSFCCIIYGDSQQLFWGTIFLLPKFQNFTLYLQRSFTMAEKLKMPTCTSIDYFKFGSGYLASIVGSTYVQKNLALSYCLTAIKVSPSSWLKIYFRGRIK